MSYENIDVLVTGADGFIGSHLAEALVEKGARVTALSAYYSLDNAGWLDELPAETRARMTILRGDIRDPAFVRRIMKGQAIVFHLAALIAIPHSYATPQSYVETNVLGTLNVLEAARELETQRVVHTSTSEVYGTAITIPIEESHPLQGQSPYSASKIGADMMAEAFARSFDLPIVTLRPFNTFGPRQSERAIIPSIIRQALDPRCDAILVGDTTPRRDLTFVADTVAAFLALGREGEVNYGTAYNAGSGQTISVAELIRAILRTVGSEKPLVQDPQRMRPANSEVRALLADASRLRLATAWQPRVSLEEGLQRTVAWWRLRLERGRVRPTIQFMT
ncbi:SDR family NAD(P)-dependent oxidoreductase [Belnapia sp. T6]|uniref:SDR family NAD(P)-dependent oxidoreductase n=1 Tax=Belnapia mucosa TaxID=2804532 RepID=A0ABS1VD88_9PROT|nr:SDR family NAD(P)-dependent oxidoreductase [Belnapia mucosa]MBL6459081.1 SDR family NAD(P)-dependent oxidoreductase [Belnapia mucosa]